ncbi:MAG: family 20 glycosylhydrolase [Hyphomicrobiales bacterium]|nr:family 20 glycosylhydrolase [Hyphomicrobiales bacterium]
MADTNTGAPVDDAIILSPFWPGPAGAKTLHLSLHNNSSIDLADFTLCMTGSLWIDESSAVQGGELVGSVSNFITIRPERNQLPPGATWSLVLTGLNEWPRRAGEGPKSAYLAFDDGRTHAITVQTLARRDRTSNPPEPVTIKAGDQPSLPAKRPTLSVIPFPNVTSVAVAGFGDRPPHFFIVGDPNPETRAVVEQTEGLAGRLFPSAGLRFAFDPDPPAEAHTASIHQSRDTRLGEAGYKLSFEGNGVQLESTRPRGLAYGLITLAQTAIGARARPDVFGFPVRGSITDVPRHRWRGVLLDVARTFYSPGEVKRVVDIAAWLKLNVLHLHLTDDEGWRFPVPAYPALTEVAAWRGHGRPIPPLLGSGPDPYGGFYTADEIAGLVHHAADLGLTVVPEADVPTHCFAALQVVPDLRDCDDQTMARSVQGFRRNALNPCRPATYRFVDAVLAEMATLFTPGHIHIGGDEISAQTWSGAPDAVLKARAMNLTNTGQLGSLVLEHAHQRLSANGINTVVWEDAVRVSHFDPQRTTVIVWQHPDKAAELAALGFKVVLSPGNAYYLDMTVSDSWDSPGNTWAGAVGLEQTYDFEPGQGWPETAQGVLEGVQACIWGEHMIDRRNFDATVFPRLHAFAERAWIDPANKNFANFRDRLEMMPASLRADSGSAR